MSLPIRTILWAGNNAQHNDHLHVEGLPPFTGVPPYYNPGMSPSVSTIFKALTAEFGTPAYFQDPAADDADWTHMGWYNRRKIAGTNFWSQHAWANALDVGPYYGVKEQQKFYDFLMNYDEENDEMSSPKNWDDADKVAWRSLLNNTLIEGTDSNFDFHIRNTYALAVQIKDIVSKLSATDLSNLQVVADAVNDEADKRARDRLGTG